MRGAISVRDARADDAASITRISNALIATTSIAWTEEPESLEDRVVWLSRQRDAGRPVLVAIDADSNPADEVVGFASYGDFRDSSKWPGYRYTVEHTVHVAESHWGRGVGRFLMDELCDRASAAGLHVMIGAIDGSNDASLRFHERIGFVEVARMPETGYKFGRWLDLVLMQRAL